MGKFASLALLAYKRPEQLRKCIDSIKETADYPYELIVNVDGGDSFSIGYCSELLNNGEISKVILNSGDNRGVGRSFQNCLGVAEGDYIFKIDTDLTFSPGWLSKAINILKNNPDIGAVSLFDYNHYDPLDNRFAPSVNHLGERSDCIIVKDFVSSIYGFHRDQFQFTSLMVTSFPDDGVHQTMRKLAITKQDYVKNHGFGVHKSVYISGTEEAPYKTPTFDEPLIFLKGKTP